MMRREEGLPSLGPPLSDAKVLGRRTIPLREKSAGVALPCLRRTNVVFTYHISAQRLYLPNRMVSRPEAKPHSIQQRLAVFALLWE